MTEERSQHFLAEIISNDLASGKHAAILTRFPPEPNGYLHIGHAKSISVNFGLAQQFGGKTNLRFDDTNPSTEETEYVESIKQDVQWLGYTWAQELYASNYFTQLYEYAVTLINKGLAYVDDSSSEAIAKQKGTPTTPGVRNEYANRSTAENLQLFTEMKAGKYADGEKVLRAKIDMAHVDMHMRDPIIYRIKHAHHHRTGNEWCIYPMYDFAHGQSDSIENITHSICTLEFIPHRSLYAWFIQQLGIFPSEQYEIARLNLTYTVMSKRKLLQLVNEGFVAGWDDPRMPTISGLRRRGYTPESIRNFCEKIGVARRDNLIEVGLLEFCVREHLNKIALRRMVVIDPLKITITNYPEGQEEMLQSEDNPEDANAGSRQIPFTNTLYIEREDFMEVAPKKYFRLAPGQMVRLKSAYIIQCNEVLKDADGNITELLCTYIPESKSGSDTAGLKVQGTLHWVSVQHAVQISINNYDRLFKVEDVDGAAGDFKDHINEHSFEHIATAYAEPALAAAKAEERFQFIRKGYYFLDKASTENQLIFNRTVSLKDDWAKKNATR